MDDDNNWHEPPECRCLITKSPNYDFADRLSQTLWC